MANRATRMSPEPLGSIAGSLTGSYPDPKNPKDASKRVESDPAVLRWEVTLVNTDDGWLVDDYAPVKSEAGQ